MKTSLRMLGRMASRRVGYILCVIGFMWGLTLINMSLMSSSNLDKDSKILKEEILGLSEKYVKTLAKETRNTIDGPYAGRLTGYDLKKTMAVLLENLMERMDTLEKRFDDALKNGTVGRHHLLEQNKQLQAIRNEIDSQRQVIENGRFAQLEQPEQQPVGVKPVDMQGLILGEQEQCGLTEEETKAFPHCKGKIAWMLSHWKSDRCYMEYGVDGSECSVRVYLSEIENWCPLLPGRTARQFNISEEKTADKKATLNFDMEGLMAKLQDPGQRQNYAWMRMRIERMWKSWVDAIKNLASKQDLSNRTQKKILVHLGLLSQKAGFKIAENSFRGGPLGELVQWSDIICTLYILGHDLTITSEVEQLGMPQYVSGAHSKAQVKACLDGWRSAEDNRQVVRLTGLKSPGARQPLPQSRQHGSCPSPQILHKPDLLFMDIVGINQFKKLPAIRPVFRSFRILSQFPSAESQCQSRDRVPVDMIYSDIVGLTQFKRKVKHGYGKFSCLLRVVDSFGTEPAFNYDVYAKSHKQKTTWGMQNLNPQQFFTMFPHSPDNSFIGFVIENHLNDTVQMPVKKDMGVVYGKVENMWQGKERYLDVIKNYVEIHGTVFLENTQEGTIIPSYVHNHGIMKGPDLHRMLRKSKLFIGLGFPYEGPAPLEAIAQGCVYINPKFIPPHNGKNTKFFHGKPTLRKVTSQHPYAEEFIGEPHVYTVDINDPDELKATLDQALRAVSSGQVQPYMPYEYTAEGMLQRVNAYLQNQDFCEKDPTNWPPPDAVTVMMAKKGRSCKETCMEKKLICEPSYFKTINSVQLIEEHYGSKCSSSNRGEDIYYPAIQPEDGQCILQSQSLLFSCVGEHEQLQRLCPCRNFIPGQTALCQTCV